MTTTNETQRTVVVGGRGKTGARVVERLRTAGRPVRAVSPSAEVPFDWADERTWGPALAGADALYLTYHPDLAVPGAADHVRGVSKVAVDQGIRTIVLLAGRGEPQVHPAEDAVRESGAAWTILECSFFLQNFTEGLLAPRGDVIAFPAGDVREPFLDCDDIADVAVAALTDEAHAGKTYELTGPELLTFGEATAELARATGRPLRYLPVTFGQYGQAMAEHFPPPVVAFFLDLFRFLLDGHNAVVTDDVERVLGRPARDVRTFAAAAARGLR
ncbi:MAG: NmrA family transcriptional regulator [Sandaracinaceae bacterium]